MFILINSSLTAYYTLTGGISQSKEPYTCITEDMCFTSVSVRVCKILQVISDFSVNSTNQCLQSEGHFPAHFIIVHISTVLVFRTCHFPPHCSYSRLRAIPQEGRARANWANKRASEKSHGEPKGNWGRRASSPVGPFTVSSPDWLKRDFPQSACYLTLGICYSSRFHSPHSIILVHLRTVWQKW